MAIKYGLYEADESPRRCKCGRSVSRVLNTWEADGVRRRKRLCVCGKEFLTQTPIRDERFVASPEKDTRFIRG